jgi:reactive intermediate/imine deaminase
MTRTNFASKAPWENVVGYSRAVRVGQHIYVTGTVAVTEKGELIAPDDAYAQTVVVIERIRQVLEKAGASLKDVVRTRMFVTDLEQWEGIAKAHHEYFGAIKPAATMVEVSRLFSEALIEMEVDAVVES